MKEYKFKRIFLIVADSMGIGNEPKASLYGDEGTNTLFSVSKSMPDGLHIPTLNGLGIGDFGDFKGTHKVAHPYSFTCASHEQSRGKDTMTGHWEMMGVYTTQPFQTFTDTGFPKELINELEKRTGHKVIGNKSASGTEIIKELGEQQLKDKSLIVYTSADSVLQIAGHEEAIGLDELYRCCEIARDICMKPEWMVARVIARPYVGTNKDNFKRIVGHRHDIAIKPPIKTVLNYLKENNFETLCIGKISDIFDGYGVNKSIKTSSNEDGMNQIIQQVKESDFTGLCFLNLVEFDSEFGHRRDPVGYGKCIESFDKRLSELLPLLKDDDLLIITADHGNDPTFTGSDHTRENVPIILFNKMFSRGTLLSERNCFGDIGSTILKNFDLKQQTDLCGTAIEEVFKQ